MNRIGEIIEEIKELVDEAYKTIPPGRERERAKGYWRAHILMALDNDHDYLGKETCTMKDSADSLDLPDEETEESED